MKGLLMLGGAPLVGGLVYAAIPEGEVYPLPADAVYAKLRYMDGVDELEKSLVETKMFDLDTVGVANRSVSWRFQLEDETIAEVVATLTPEDAANTRVVVNFALHGDARTTANAEFKHGQEFMTNVMRIALEEGIDATLEERKFDEEKVKSALMTYAAMNPRAVQGMMQDIQRLENDPEAAERIFGGFSERMEKRADSRDAPDPRDFERALERREDEVRARMAEASRPSIDPTR